MAHGFGGPGGGFVGVTGGAGIWDFVFIGHGWGDEGKGVGTDFSVSDGGGDFRHVAGNATASGGVFFVMGVFFDGAGAWAVER